MSDHVEKLQFILESLSIIEERMLLIKKDSDFVDSKNGLLILDAITMRLQAIGDS